MDALILYLKKRFEAHQINPICAKDQLKVFRRKYLQFS